MDIPASGLPELIARLVIGLPLLLVTGWSVARLVVPDTDTDAGSGVNFALHDAPMIRLAVALGWGIGIVPTIAFFGHLLFGLAVSELAVTAIAAAQLLAITLFLRSSEAFEAAAIASVRPWHGMGALWTHHRGPVLAATAIFALWFIKHDASIPSGSCVTQAAAVASGWDPTAFDLLRGNLGDNRLGNAGVIAGAMAVFGSWSFRVLYGLLAAMMAVGGWSLGRSVVQTRWAGWLGLLLLPLNPYVASLPLIDENFLTLATTATFLPLVVRRTGDNTVVKWLVIGALYGLAATMRHPLALAFPALVFAALQADKKAPAALALIGGATALTALEHAHHLLAFGSLLKFESNAYFLPQSYSFLGADFRYNGMLNWPFHDALIRTPHNPWPTWFLWPLAVVDHLGYVLFAALLVGFVAAWRRRSRALFWLLWFAPVMASLAVQEAWDYPNKMGVILVVFAPLVVWVVEGVAAVVRRPKAGAVALVAMLLASVAAVAAVQGVDVPADARYFAHYQLPAHESQSWLRAARDRAAGIAPWPDFGRLSRYGEVLDARKLAVIGREHEQSPAWGWHPGEVPPRGEPVTVLVDLRDPPWHRTDIVRSAPANTPVHVDLVKRPARHIAADITLPWEQHKAWLTAINGPNVTVLELGFLARDAAACVPEKDQRRCKFYGTFDRGIDERANAAAQVVNPRGPVIAVRLPAGAVSFAVSINERGNVVELWKSRVDAKGVTTEGPYAFWHN